ncbi:hypothetical protein FACS189452_07440 [Bacteroidia bacterium]|nr:hypothetical protein FACS189452_07440 [Bacteroidia bacterium]
MCTKFKYYHLVLLLLGLAAGRTSSAQALSLDVQAPRVVNVGEAFRMTFVANQNVDNFTPPSIEGFSVMAGPAQSSSQNVSIVNGNVTRSIQISFTYTLVAEREGKFTIGAAHVRSGNAEAHTTPFVIECVNGGGAAQNTQRTQGASNNSANDDNSLFLYVAVNKREVYRGEHLSATIKLYSRGTGIAGIENPKMPTFNGFWNQDIETPKQIEFKRENVNGTVYDAGVLFKQLLFPQQTGDIVINPAELDVIVQVRTRSRDIFDDFFGGGVQNVRRSLKSKSVTIKVKDLPVGAPKSFSGAVGNFKIESSISANKITANDGITLTIKISGNGNLKLINAPKVSFPPDFEVYETKPSESIKNTEAGANGYRQFEVSIIPRSAGEFEIPAVEFSYFNPATHQYVTLQTKPHNLLIEKDTRATDNYSTTEPHRSDIKHLGQDIRFIKTDPAGRKSQPATFMGTAQFYLLYLLLIVLFVVSYLLLKKYVRDSQNVVLVKNRKANKMAKKRLNAAAHLLKMNKAQGFYEELLRASWDYLSNKLNIPMAELSRDAAQSSLAERNIPEEDIQTFLSVVNECEFARYAPSGGQQAMEHLYQQAVQVISKLEQRIR